MTAPRAPNFVDGLYALDAVQTRARLAVAKKDVELNLGWATGPAADGLKAALAQVDADLLAAARQAVETLSAALVASQPPPTPEPAVKPTLPTPGRPFTQKLPARPAEPAAAPAPAPRVGGLSGVRRAVTEADPPAAPEPAEAPTPPALPPMSERRMAPRPPGLPPLNRPRPQAPAGQRPIGIVADDLEIPW